MHNVDAALWIGVCSSLVAVVSLLIPKETKQSIQEQLDSFTLWVSYYDAEKIFSWCKGGKGRLMLSAIALVPMTIACVIDADKGKHPLELFRNISLIDWLIVSFYAVSSFGIVYGGLYFYGKSRSLTAALWRAGYAVLAVAVIGTISLVALSALGLAGHHGLIKAVFIACVAVPVLVAFSVGYIPIGLFGLLKVSHYLARGVSFVLWGIVGHKEGALAGILVLVTAGLGVAKLFFDK